MPTNHYLPPELFNRAHFLFDNSYRQMDVYAASLVVWQIINRCIEGTLSFTIITNPIDYFYYRPTKL